MYLSGAVLKIFVRKFSAKHIKASLAEFAFSKIPCFQYILLKTFKRMRLNYVNCFLRRILFYILKQHSDYKSLIAKTFKGKTLKMKAFRTI